MANLLFILGLVILAMVSPYDAVSKRLDKSTMTLLQLTFRFGRKDTNVVSPLSLMMVVPLFSHGANDETKNRITAFLGGTDYKKTSYFYRDFSVQLSELNPNALTVANKVYVSDRFRLQDSFTAIARSYRSEIDFLDFSDVEDAADTMNEWADEKTQGNIDMPVSPDMLDNGVAVALFNVIYFEGHWRVPFDSEETRGKDFHVSKETVVKKPMMHLLQPLYYTECLKLDARMLELPYKEKGFRMVVVLPKKVDGLPSLLEEAAQEGLLNDVFRLKLATVDLDIPQFDTKSEVPDIINSAAMHYPRNAAAGGIVQDRLVAVETSFQEGFIDVDEEGARVGAFTGLTIQIREKFDDGFVLGLGLLRLQIRSAAVPPIVRFKVDRPFLYLILYEDIILLAGTYTG